MNRRIFAVAVLITAISAIAVLGQDGNSGMAGKWKMDMDKSELGERSRIQSMEMNVDVSGNSMSVERMPKLAERGGGGMGGGRGMMGGGKLTYDLSGKETSASGGMGGEVKLTAVSEAGALKLKQVRSIETQMGAMTLTTVETWKLSADGKTLTIDSSTETPRGSRTQKMVFVKQ